MFSVSLYPITVHATVVMAVGLNCRLTASHNHTDLGHCKTNHFNGFLVVDTMYYTTFCWFKTNFRKDVLV